MSDTATINDVEERSKVNMFIRRTIRFVFIIVSLREHGSLMLLILRPLLLRRARVVLRRRYLRSFTTWNLKLLKRIYFHGMTFIPASVEARPGSAFVRDPTTAAFCIYAHAAARNPILEYHGKKRDEPIRSPWVYRRGRAGRECRRLWRYHGGTEYVCTWARDNGHRNSITRTAS